MQERSTNYYDYEKRRPIINARVLSFEQDIRDYISASVQAIIIKYRPEHFRFIPAAEKLLGKSNEFFKEPSFF